MRGEIATAIERLNERKRAAAGVGPGQMWSAADLDTLRRAWSGLDLDVEEADALSPSAVLAFGTGLSSGAPPHLVATALFFDGIATGLLIAEAREREGV